jgi:hypothetical protein
MRSRFAHYTNERFHHDRCYGVRDENDSASASRDQFGICIHSGGAGMNTGRFSAGCPIIDNPDGYFRDPTWSNFWLPIRDGMKEHNLPTIPYMLVDVGDLG